MRNQQIPIEILDVKPDEPPQTNVKLILENEIKDIRVEHITMATSDAQVDYFNEEYKTIYLFLTGAGNVTAESKHYEIVPETIFLPNAIGSITIKPTNGDSLSYLKIVCKQSAQDLKDIQQLPIQNTQNVYYAKFTDCQSYTEAIKSPNTVSRTILSNEYIPRIAMGTVQTIGPDKVAAHEHPMLEQLFLGLAKNNCTVYADDAEIAFPEHSVLHIPLGSSHSVAVERDNVLYYVWMDFFLDKKGEQWLKTHKSDADQ